MACLAVKLPQTQAHVDGHLVAGVLEAGAADVAPIFDNQAHAGHLSGAPALRALVFLLLIHCNNNNNINVI